MLLARRINAALFNFATHSDFQERNLLKTIVGRGGAANAGLLLMDILASILAYLGCVTGIVGALALSFFLFFAAPDQSTMPIHAAAIAAKPIAAKTATVAEVAPASKNEPAIKNEQAIASDVAKTDDVAQAETAPPTPVVVSSRQKRQQLAAHLRRLAQEERARRWAYQQDPDFEARFLGYAD